MNYDVQTETNIPNHNINVNTVFIFSKMSLVRFNSASNAALLQVSEVSRLWQISVPQQSDPFLLGMQLMSFLNPH